ncbi:MAG: hypothetical protein ACXAEU_25540 [Candidatus Hodarchaeales archaeon]|jgi:hypothetical protein
MSDSLLKEILNGMNNLSKRMERLEWLILELKFPEVDPTPEEKNIIDTYEKEKKEGKVEYSKFV